MVGTSPTMTLEQIVLPDILGPGLRVVFCGTQAGAASARRGAYYAGPGNKFWKTLHEIGLTPERLAPEAFPTLPSYGIGLTDIAKLTFGPDTELRSAHFDGARFRARMAESRPRTVAFNGKRAAQAILGPVPGYGLQPSRLAASDIFVLPSTSGAASGFWSIEPWRELAAHLARSETR